MLCDGEEHLLLFLPPPVKCEVYETLPVGHKLEEWQRLKRYPQGFPVPALLSRPRHSDDGVQFACVADLLLMPVDDVRRFIL